VPLAPLSPAEVIINTSSPTNLAAGQATAPSLLWKAYANALLPFLSLNSDLCTVDQAMFIASPLQPGVPANNIVPEAVTNYQQYIKADCVQTKGIPIYSLENSSYFGQLWMQVSLALFLSLAELTGSGVYKT
jgi:hypothetical protein